jgi:hypothetical protein
MDSQSIEYPNAPIPSDEKLTEDIRRLDVTKKGFFLASTYIKYADWIISSFGQLAFATCAVSTAVHTINSKFPSANLPSLPKNLLMVFLYASIPALGITYKVDFAKEHDKHFAAGVEYNILSRRLELIRSIQDKNEKTKAWQQYHMLRDDAERKYSTYCPDFINRIAKEEILKAKQERESKLKKIN